MRARCWRWGLPALAWTLILPTEMSAQCPLGATGGSTVASVLRLKPGESRRTLLTTDQTTSQTLMGQEQTAHQVMSMGVRYDVENAAADGQTRIRISYESMRLRVSTPMGGFAWDSSDTTAAVPAGAEMFAALVGRGYTVVMAPDGSDRHVEGWDSLMDSMLGAMSLPPGVTREDLRTTLQDTFGDDFMSNIMRAAVATVPPKLGAVGDSWTCTNSADGAFPMTQTATWTLRDRKGGIGTMDVASEVASDSTASRSVGSMSVRYAVNGRNTGTVEVEEATGWIIRSRFESELSGKATMEGTPMGAMQIPMNLKTVTTTEPITGS
jgi:hypothetical protein